MLILPIFCLQSVYAAIHEWHVLLAEVLWVRVSTLRYGLSVCVRVCLLVAMACLYE
jgi:hypothetical protein